MKPLNAHVKVNGFTPGRDDPWPAPRPLVAADRERQARRNAERVNERLSAELERQKTLTRVTRLLIALLLVTAGTAAFVLWLDFSSDTAASIARAQAALQPSRLIDGQPPLTPPLKSLTDEAKR